MRGRTKVQSLLRPGRRHHSPRRADGCLRRYGIHRRHILFANVNEYWLDVTGSVSGLTAGVNGYIGGGTGGVLYATKNGVHSALAQNIETIQFQYNGDSTPTAR